MVDACVIERNPDGETDSTLDTGTGLLASPPGQPVTIYDATSIGDAGRSLADEDGLGGKCKVRPMTESPPRFTDEGGEPILPRPYKASIPWDAPEPQTGDTLTIVSSRWDPGLDGTPFTVKEVTRSSMLVGRRLVLERRA